MKLKRRQLFHGMEVRCVIDGTLIEDAKISIDYSGIYICQNELEGLECSDKLGYKYSWLYGVPVTRYSEEVTMLKFVNSKN